MNFPQSLIARAAHTHPVNQPKVLGHRENTSAAALRQAYLVEIHQVFQIFTGIPPKICLFLMQPLVYWLTQRKGEASDSAVQ
jgi:hypothetical protein